MPGMRYKIRLGPCGAISSLDQLPIRVDIARPQMFALAETLTSSGPRPSSRMDRSIPLLILSWREIHKAVASMCSYIGGMPRQITPAPLNVTETPHQRRQGFWGAPIRWGGMSKAFPADVGPRHIAQRHNHIFPLFCVNFDLTTCRACSILEWCSQYTARVSNVRMRVEARKMRPRDGRAFHGG